MCLDIIFPFLFEVFMVFNAKQYFDSGSRPEGDLSEKEPEKILGSLCWWYEN